MVSNVVLHRTLIRLAAPFMLVHMPLPPPHDIALSPD
jgi:hypothetical protein